MNLTQLKAIIVVTPIVTGVISFLASLTIIVSIKRSNLKLTNIYRRLIFLTSFFDIFQSLGNAFSTAPMPHGIIWGAVGNNFTCDVQGFCLVFGASGALWYSLSLTLYFFLVVVVKMPEPKIKKNIEPFLHGFPIIYALSVSILILVLGNYNPTNTLCWIGEEPLGCSNNPDVECTSKGGVALLQWVAVGIPVFTVFIFNTAMLAIIVWNMKRQQNKGQSYRHSWILQDGDEQQDEEKGCMKKFGCLKRRGKKDKAPKAQSVLAQRLSRTPASSIQRTKEISYRAIAYIGGYFATYFFAALYRLLMLYGNGMKIPFAIIYIARFTYPLQGFFNILVYTYPHVMSCRRNDESLSWIRAFWIVVKSGGDSDTQRSGRTNRRASLRKKKLLKEKYNIQSKTSDVDATTPSVKRKTVTRRREKKEETKEEFVPFNTEITNNSSHTIGKKDKTIVLNDDNEASRGLNDICDDVAKDPSSSMNMSLLDNNEEIGGREESTPMSIIDVEANITSNDNEVREELVIPHKLDNETVGASSPKTISLGGDGDIQQASTQLTMNK